MERSMISPRRIDMAAGFSGLATMFFAQVIICCSVAVCLGVVAKPSAFCLRGRKSVNPHTVYVEILYCVCSFVLFSFGACTEFEVQHAEQGFGKKWCGVVRSVLCSSHLFSVGMNR